MSQNSYKERHEDFVTGLTGGPILEIYIVMVVAVACYYSWAVLQSRWLYFKNSYSLTSLVADFCFNWLGLLLSITTYANDSFLLSALIVAPTSIVGVFWGISDDITRKAKPKPRLEPLNSASVSSYLPRKSYLSVYRGGMMVATCLAILAVDFHVFPRKFAKVETWGTSLMDLGVGSFVFSMGLVSSRTTLVNAYLERKTPHFKAIGVAFRQCLSVLLLGTIRLILVKFLDYQEHVTEYGVHWNFFMTLGLLPPFVAIIDILPSWVPTGVIGLVIAALYEILLDRTNLGAYVLTAPRTDIISANKEGIFSFIGYLAIFLSGKATGFYVLPSKINLKSYFYPLHKNEVKLIASDLSKNDTRYRVVILLFLSSFAYNMLLFMVSKWLTPSRRLANLAYMLWVVSFNTLFLALFILVELMLFPDQLAYQLKVPVSLEAINQNGLVMFLLANVATGLININVKTLDVSRPFALIILILYAITLFCATVSMAKYHLKIKL